MTRVADEYYWYTANNGVPECDWLFVKKANHYGFVQEPSYELIEKYDLRFVMMGSWNDLTNIYF